MNNLQVLMNGVFGRTVPAEFAAENYDYEAALHDELVKLLCDDKGHFSRAKYRRNKNDLFELLERNLEDILPRNVSDALNLFAEVMNVQQGSRLVFRVSRGKQRGKQFVTRATPSGNYEAFRLDNDYFEVFPVALGGSGIIDFERYLDGVESIIDIYEVINEGMVDRIFEMVQDALLQTWKLAGRPANNKISTNGFDAASMVRLCNTVSAYGTPTIYCAPEFAADMANAIIYNSTTKIADQDLIDVRERGYIGKFHGVPVVVLPQSFVDDTNAKLAINPSFAYVLPSGKEKIVKIGFEGSPYFKEWEHEGDNGIQLQAYVKVGCGVLSTPNYWGLYYNSALNSYGGWAAYNSTLTA